MRAAKGDEGRELSPEDVSGGRVDAMPDGFDADAKERKKKVFITHVIFVFSKIIIHVTLCPIYLLQTRFHLNFVYECTSFFLIISFKIYKLLLYKINIQIQKVF